MKKLDFRSISIQLLALVLIVAIVPVIVLSYNTNSTISADKYANFKDKTDDAYVMAEQAYKSQLDRATISSVKIGNDPRIVNALKNDDATTLKQLIDEYSKKNSYMHVITITDEKAVVMARSASTNHGDVTSNSHILGALSGKEYAVTDLIPAESIRANNLENMISATKTSDGLAMINCLPVKDENGIIIGSVYTAQILNNEFSVVDYVSGHSGSYCTVFQGDTRVSTTLKNDKGERIIGTKASEQVVSTVITNGQKFEDIITVNGLQLYVHYEPLKNADGKTVGMLFVGYDIGPGLAQLNNMTMQSLMIGAVISIIAVLVGFLIVNRVTRPINKLVVVANSVAEGNLDTPVETGAKGGEVGELTDAVKKMVANIKEKIAFNESILKGIRTPMFVTDMDRKITYFNDACSEMTGFSREDVIGKQCKDVFNTPVCHTEQCMLKRAWREGDLKGAEGNITLRGGKVIDFSCDATAVKDQHGKTVGGMELLQDITESKLAKVKIEKAEKEAREKATYSEAILKSIKDIHVVISKDGNITYTNEPAQNYIGYSASEMAGKRLTDITKLEKNGGKLIDALRTGMDILGLDDSISLRNGKYLPVLINGTIIKDANGNTTGLSIIARDITKEKDAQANLNAIIVKANEIADRVAKASQQVSSSTNQAMTSSRQISESIQQIASGSQSQAQQVDEISRLIRGISTESSNMSDSSKKASEALQAASETSRAGGEAANVAISKMSDIQKSVNGSAEIVKDLGEKSKQIGKIVDVITSIASQTNLLALNAAIEAARAGEAGRGFAVVAEEVRKLAEEAAKSTEQISDLVNQIKERTDMAVESMDRGTDEVSSGSDVVAKALKSIEEISYLINETATIAHGVSTATEKQVRDTLEVVKSIEQISAVVEESASSTEEVSASAEESTATMEEIANMSQQLSKIADELKAEVSKLKVD
ncbi:hypothetical protein CUJ83_00415 [Methanocella sp. CWC-04]|uniref:Methyl-accepting chemotaxis sensory transducer with Pas/Pac sensor n=1 Tax=Methanooceanicella nereidis TaxID=2052831 RepID=A0AAP2W3S9_9EURY|nr:methyl-accepting chemotaxis protein [Methanocella sp. CWC-04]MCD1293460.1 hypothetical protein [Methanocella sp. CWC-04]